MNCLKALGVMAIAITLWSGSRVIKDIGLNQLVESGKIPYGPIPNEEMTAYSFNGLHSAFNPNLELKRADEFSKKRFEEIVLSSLSPLAKQNLEQYLTSTLELSVEYQVDPFWVLSIMMVESEFNFKAQSSKNARGLMQIRPETASHMYQLMGKKISGPAIQSKLHHPAENIEVGIFYLKKLLHNFRLNYPLATIAYNIGPSRLKNLLSGKEIDVVNFSYLIKVQDTYKQLTKHFSIEIKKQARPYELTYVVLGQGSMLEDQLLKQYIKAAMGSTISYLLTSENPSHLSFNSLPF